jgi:hypothetical protein
MTASGTPVNQCQVDHSERKLLVMHAEQQHVSHQLAGIESLLERLVEKDLQQRQSISAKPRIAEEVADVMFRCMLPLSQA